MSPRGRSQSKAADRAEAEERRDYIVRTLRAEVVRPVDMSWDDGGAILRALSGPLHRVLNKAITDLELAVAAGGTLEVQDGRTGKTKVVSRLAYAYNQIKRHWADERRRAAEAIPKFEALATQAAEALSRARSAVETPGLTEEELKEAEKQARKRESELAAAQRTVATLQAQSTLEPTSKVLNQVTAVLMARWKKWNELRWSGEMTLPTFSRRSPIYVRDEGVRLYKEGRHPVLELKLVVDPNVIRLGLRVDGAGAHAQLNELLENPDNVRSAQVCQNSHGAWSVRIAFREAKRLTTGKRVMALHRGMLNFITAAIEKDEGAGAKKAITKVLEHGGAIVEHKRRYQARRRSLGWHGKSLGRGAKGHGHDRRYERLTELSDAEARFVQTKCQETAAHAIRMAKWYNVGHILVESWTAPRKRKSKSKQPDTQLEAAEVEETSWYVRNWPWAQLLGCIEWAAKKEGIKVTTVPGCSEGLLCPNCGSPDGTTDSVGTYKCPACDLKRPRDIIYSWSMLRAVGAEPGIKEDAAVRRKLARAVRQANAGAGMQASGEEQAASSKPKRTRTRRMEKGG